MSWVFKIASDLIKEAMTSSEPAPEPVPHEGSSQPTYDVVPLIARHRAEIDKNIGTVVEMLNAQNERHIHAMKLQQRWNYGLAAGVAVALILVIVSLWRS